MKENKGFSLIELMMVVAITGILGAVAIPMFSKYVKKSKTSEAPTNLRKIFDGEISYFNEDHTNSAGQVVSKQFLATTVDPTWPPTPDKRIGNFNTSSWNFLKFNSDSPVQYVYFADAYPFDNPYPSRPTEYDVTLDPPSGMDYGVQVSAIGDLDGDGKYAVFQRGAKVATGSTLLEVDNGIMSLDELE